MQSRNAAPRLKEIFIFKKSKMELAFSLKIFQEVAYNYFFEWKVSIKYSGLILRQITYSIHKTNIMECWQRTDSDW
jgi:hypothetical protein